MVAPKAQPSSTPSDALGRSGSPGQLFHGACGLACLADPRKPDLRSFLPNHEMPEYRLAETAAQREGIPRSMPMVPQTPDATFTGSAVTPTANAWMQPSIRRPMSVPFQPLPVLTAMYLVPQHSVWLGVPGVPGHIVQLPPRGPPGWLQPGVNPPRAPVQHWRHPVVAAMLLPQAADGAGAQGCAPQGAPAAWKHLSTTGPQLPQPPTSNF